MSPALAGGLFTTVPPRKSQVSLLKKNGEKIQVSMFWAIDRSSYSYISQSLCSCQARHSVDRTVNDPPNWHRLLTPLRWQLPQWWEQSCTASHPQPIWSLFSFLHSSLWRCVQYILTKLPRKSSTSWESLAGHCWPLFLKGPQAYSLLLGLIPLGHNLAPWHIWYNPVSLDANLSIIYMYTGWRGNSRPELDGH